MMVVLLSLAVVLSLLRVAVTRTCSFTKKLVEHDSRALLRVFAPGVLLR